ncbi:MAG: hemolysin III family protein [Natronospirillum sp.]|uniref:PAQR family membrane homeostasis protein TrhA n=1 Tax=Natronospirillum sp. TaxID=2812955 RepID=UPI0025D15D55|nr:hemolysin III family protein [Natronospirillum sp.]MCH8552058.1 hemolysin III family protein [Natronospirillum sp.]
MYRGELFNSISHLVGAVASLAGMAALITAAAIVADTLTLISVSVYGLTLVLLYTASTLYHSFRGTAKNIFKKIDHYAIYFLIAGTYTPFTLVTLGGAWGWSIFGVVWGLAILGIVIEVLPFDRRRILPVIIYLLMGWVVVVALAPLVRSLPTAGLIWLAAGGLTYTLGVIFYALDERIPHGHGIWHLFVLVGSICHYITILVYVVLAPNGLVEV